MGEENNDLVFDETFLWKAFKGQTHWLYWYAMINKCNQICKIILCFRIKFKGNKKLEKIPGGKNSEKIFKTKIKQISKNILEQISKTFLNGFMKKIKRKMKKFKNKTNKTGPKSPTNYAASRFLGIIKLWKI